MPTRLVLLGLLQEQPMYGYEIKQIIEERMGDWTSIAFGSIYFALSKLAEEGFIERFGVEQEGNRPSRSVYQITEAGSAEFLHLLRQVWHESERHYYAIDIGLFFIRALPVSEVKRYLQTRTAQLKTIVQELISHRTKTLEIPNIPPLTMAIFDHSLAHLQAELAWIKDLLGKVE